MILWSRKEWSDVQEEVFGRQVRPGHIKVLGVKNNIIAEKVGYDNKSAIDPAKEFAHSQARNDFQIALAGGKAICN